ncbi:MAG: hypothetical protein CVV23_00180 [Ignavibacteriae bacterium HGW-Ignavibacteriae-2]|jgi:hypothetical protein|nr:MAG: hypothetical protein CVV23_00180 [Ignavibacteriae bacterium HGW-Ignavibacteriae-2]
MKKNVLVIFFALSFLFIGSTNHYELGKKQTPVCPYIKNLEKNDKKTCPFIMKENEKKSSNSGKIKSIPEKCPYNGNKQEGLKNKKTDGKNKLYYI